MLYYCVMHAITLLQEVHATAHTQRSMNIFFTLAPSGVQYFAQLGAHSDTFQMAPAGTPPHMHAFKAHNTHSTQRAQHVAHHLLHTRTLTPCHVQKP